MSTPYRTAPIETKGIPSGIPYIVGNEAAERFSFYGMKTILVVFMTQYLLSAQGQPNYMTDTQAREWMHLFVASAYFFPVIGAIISIDSFHLHGHLNCVWFIDCHRTLWMVTI